MNGVQRHHIIYFLMHLIKFIMTIVIGLSSFIFNLHLIYHCEGACVDSCSYSQPIYIFVSTSFSYIIRSFGDPISFISNCFWSSTMVSFLLEIVSVCFYNRLSCLFFFSCHSFENLTTLYYSIRSLLIFLSAFYNFQVFYFLNP